MRYCATVFTYYARTQKNAAPSGLNGQLPDAQRSGNSNVTDFFSSLLLGNWDFERNKNYRARKKFYRNCIEKGNLGFLLHVYIYIVLHAQAAFVFKWSDGKIEFCGGCVEECSNRQLSQSGKPGNCPRSKLRKSAYKLEHLTDYF